ncbi:uncharacterized protein [Danio rerio]|uniref:Uncharacterized protein n=1 Tax=Danio rerio TaxID=7955 RepID=A0AC58J8P1_DANRE
MEHLYSQTGKTLTPVLQNPEEEDRLVEEVHDEDLQDDGFEEEIMEDITVPVLYEDDPCRDLRNSPLSSPLPQSPALLAEPSTSAGGEGQLPSPAPSVPSQPSKSGDSLSVEAQGVVIGPDGIAGWDKVQDLAAYLVGLREAPYLTDLQVTEAIQLWTALLDVDKQRINYQPRHQPQLTHGRFKAPNRSGVTPGVESVKRCLIGHPEGPAQWPSTSRLVEAICTKLCAVHKSTSKKAGVRTHRWSKILTDYHHIRDLVLGSRRLMDETVIQLFELNQKTLIQWFQRRQKDQEMSVLPQGLTPIDPIAVAATQLPLPRGKLDEAPTTSGPKHQFVFPPNKEGQAPLLRPGRKSASATTTVCSFLPDATTVCSFPPAPMTVCPIAPTPTTVYHIAPAPTMVCPVTPTFTTVRPISPASTTVCPIIPASTTVRPIAPAPTTVRLIVSAPTTVCSFPPTPSTVCPIAPPPTAPGVVQPISGPGSLFGTLVFNPDMSVSMEEEGKCTHSLNAVKSMRKKHNTLKVTKTYLTTREICYGTGTNQATQSETSTPQHSSFKAVDITHCKPGQVD